MKHNINITDVVNGKYNILPIDSISELQSIGEMFRKYKTVFVPFTPLQLRTVAVAANAACETMAMPADVLTIVEAFCCYVRSLNGET